MIPRKGKKEGLTSLLRNSHSINSTIRTRLEMRSRLLRIYSAPRGSRPALVDYICRQRRSRTRWLTDEHTAFTLQDKVSLDCSCNDAGSNLRGLSRLSRIYVPAGQSFSASTMASIAVRCCTRRCHCNDELLLLPLGKQSRISHEGPCNAFSSENRGQHRMRTVFLEGPF